MVALAVDGTWALRVLGLQEVEAAHQLLVMELLLVLEVRRSGLPHRLEMCVLYEIQTMRRKELSGRKEEAFQLLCQRRKQGENLP